VQDGDAVVGGAHGTQFKQHSAFPLASGRPKPVFPIVARSLVPPSLLSPKTPARPLARGGLVPRSSLLSPDAAARLCSLTRRLPGRRPGRARPVGQRRAGRPR
jgi:hypothetical protein